MFIAMKRIGKVALIGLGVMGASAANQADAGLVLSFEAAKVQTSQVAGVTTETFNSATPGVYTNLNGAPSAVGTFTSPGIAILAANAYGGAGGTGNYFCIGSHSGTLTATLNFSSAQSYFGFWWSAADSNNGVDLYSAGKQIGSFSASTALASLGSAYYGNPNSNLDPSEKFAYINFTGTNGTTFDQVVFRSASTATGFEADNFSIRSGVTTVSGTVVANGIVVATAAIPEPSSLALVTIGGLMGGGAWLHGRRRTTDRG